MQARTQGLWVKHSSFVCMRLCARVCVCLCVYLFYALPKYCSLSSIVVMVQWLVTRAFDILLTFIIFSQYLYTFLFCLCNNIWKGETLNMPLGLSVTVTDLCTHVHSLISDLG